MRIAFLTSFLVLLPISFLRGEGQQDFTDLLRDLKTGTPAARAHAAAELAGKGPAAAQAVPALIIALEDPSVAVRHEALLALQRIGPPAQDSIPAFQKLLTSDHALIRTQAARALGLLGAEAEPALRELTAALKDQDISVRHEAAAAIGAIGPGAEPAVPALVEALNDDHAMKIQAAHALARIGAGSVSRLGAIVKDKGRGRWAVSILGELGPAAAPAVDSLRAALKSATDEFAREIMRTLGRIGPDAAAAAPELIEILNGKDNKLRLAAANALGNVRATDAIPVLEKLVQAEDTEEGADLALAAAGGLVLIEGPKGEHLPLVLPRLIAGLDNKSRLIRREAATVIGAVGPAAAAAIPALVRGLQDPDPGVCIDSLRALTSVASGKQTTRLVPQVMTLLSSKIPYVRYTACYALGSFGATATEAVPLLEGNLRDPDTHLQVTSAWALVRIRPNNRAVAEECLAPLVRGLKMPDPQGRAEAARTLGSLGPWAQAAIEPLGGLLEDNDENVRQAAQDSLQKIQASATSGSRPKRAAPGDRPTVPGEPTKKAPR